MHNSAERPESDHYAGATDIECISAEHDHEYNMSRVATIG